MKTKFITAILSMLSLILGGCQEGPRSRDNVLFWNAYWDIIALNDSTVMAIPCFADTVPMIMSTIVRPPVQMLSSKKCHGENDEE